MNQRSKENRDLLEKGIVFASVLEPGCHVVLDEAYTGKYRTHRPLLTVGAKSTPSVFEDAVLAGYQ